MLLLAWHAVLAREYVLHPVKGPRVVAALLPFAEWHRSCYVAMFGIDTCHQNPESSATGSDPVEAAASTGVNAADSGDGSPTWQQVLHDSV